MVIAGAGCGDPELITVKAVRYLQQADVVLTDRLVSNNILTAYVNANAEIIYVGKQCGRGYSTPQEYINALLVDHAREGKLVVRLKGGDVSVFSNILDELQTLAAYHIPYEIIPGITAAAGAAAYSGIPLTARGYATAVRFLTNYQHGIINAAYWKDLAQTDDTLVFYMSAEKLSATVRNLTENKIADDKWLAVIEQATTPMQKVHACQLYEYHSKLDGLRFASPTLVMIGKVVALHQQFAWLPDNSSNENYFKPGGSLVNAPAAENILQHVSRA